MRRRLQLSSCAVISLSLVLFDSCAPVPPPRPAGETSDSSLQETGTSSKLNLRQGSTLFYLDRLGGVVAPASQQVVSISSAEPLVISGWAVDAEARTLASGVDVVIDQTPLKAEYLMDRGDVASYYKNPAYSQAGFMLVLDPSTLAAGTHQLRLRIISKDGKSYWGSKPIAFVME